MTTLRRHLEDLDPAAWAALTKRTAEYAVAAAERLGRRPPAQLVALASMTEAQLVKQRQRSGAATTKRPTARMRIIEADHRRALAEQRARDAEQERKDAVADATAARKEARESTRAAEMARERARAADADSVRKHTQWAAERREMQAAVERITAERDQLRAESAAEVAVAREQAQAAQQRADQSMAARAAERAAGQRAIEDLQTQLEHAGAEAVTAREQARAAQERADQSMAARAAERAAGQRAIEELQAQLDQTRSDTVAELVAAREQARSAQQRAEQRIDERAAARAAGQRELEDLRAQFDQARADAAAELAAAREQAWAAQGKTEQVSIEQLAGAQLLTMPIPPWGIRPKTLLVENELAALHRISYTLEVEVAEQADSRIPLDAQVARNCVQTIRTQADALLNEFHDLPTRFAAGAQAQEAADYAAVASASCRAFLQRIGAAAQRVNHRRNGEAGAVIDAVAGMLADPAVQRLSGRLGTAGD